MGVAKELKSPPYKNFYEVDACLCGSAAAGNQSASRVHWFFKCVSSPLDVLRSAFDFDCDETERLNLIDFDL